MYKTAAFLLSVLALSMAPASQALADRCGHYANRAMQQLSENQRNRCGFSGARWGGNKGTHYNWCKSVPENQSRRESDERNRMLNQCKQKKSQNDGRCQSYANRAVSQQRQNRSRGCGYSGSEWQDNYQTHFEWCKRTNWNQVQSQSRRRQDDLNRCKGGGRCRDYARRAVDQYNRNRRDGCNYSGPEWQSSYNEHYDWCQHSPWNKVQDQENYRSRKLNDCRDNRGSCNSYARRAVDQYREARRLNCSAWGPRWQYSYDEHLDWCRRSPWNKVQEESRSRDKELRRCYDRRGGSSGGYNRPYGQGSGYGGNNLGRRDCESFARQAEEQNRSNVRKACGYTSVQWVMGYQWQKQWCEQQPWAAAVDLLNVRNSQLGSCRR